VANRDFSRPFAGADAELTFPGVLTRGATGPGVRRVQEWLTLRGIKTAIDGDFGPTTERALRAFQAGRETASPGVVDDRTWAALTAPLRRAMAPIDGTGKTLNELVCLYARQHLAERPFEVGGPNDGPWVRAYMLGNGGKIWQWCSGWACLVLAQACAARGVPMPFVPSFGVPQVVRSAKARGRFLPDGPAAPGDLFVIPTARGSWCHIGVVLEWGTPMFLSGEGNTNAAGGSDGTCARSMRRTTARCDFLRVG
jgi:hypothetical protein